MNSFDDPEGDGEVEEDQLLPMAAVVDEPYVEPPAEPADHPLSPPPCGDAMHVDEGGPIAEGGQLGGRDDGMKWFVPASSFNGAVPGWAFKKGGAGLGYYRECGRATVLLAELFQPPARPRPPLRCAIRQ